MRIGIITLPLETNYGGILQNYALQKVLLRMGHEVFTVDWHNIRQYSSLKQNLLGWVNRICQRIIRKKNISILWNPFITTYQLNVIAKNTTNFINKHISLTRRITTKEFAIIDSEYRFDGYVVGSDQVWVNSYSLHSFLNFVNRKNVVRVTYAASSNDNSWLKESFLRSRCKELAKSFSGLSAREMTLASSAELVLGRTVETVLDPTLLLSIDEYKQLYHEELVEDSGSYLFSYILDTNIAKSNIVNLVCKEFGYSEITNMPKKEFVKKTHMNLNDYVFPPVEGWLKCFETASFIITDSFHGTVFSIIYNKPFIVIANVERGIARFNSLLEQLGLRTRLVTSGDSISHIIKIANERIDYQIVNERIEYLKKTSIQFLEKSLNS